MIQTRLRSSCNKFVFEFVLLSWQYCATGDMSCAMGGHGLCYGCWVSAWLLWPNWQNKLDKKNFFYFISFYDFRIIWFSSIISLSFTFFIHLKFSSLKVITNLSFLLLLSISNSAVFTHPPPTTKHVKCYTLMIYTSFSRQSVSEWLIANSVRAVVKVYNLLVVTLYCQHS